MKSIQAYLFPIFCVLVSIVLIIVVVNPSLDKLKAVKQQLVELKESERQVEKLIADYDQLREKYQAVSDQDRQVLEKVLPSNINNVRLILELERIAELRGLGFKDVDVVLKKDENQQSQIIDVNRQQLRKVVASITLVGDYGAFVQYLSDLEKSLRLITMKTIDFQAQRQEKKPTQFEYKLVLETYWFVYPEVTPVQQSSDVDSAQTE
jgi:Tfp pilus assembly protein PilO